MREWMNRGRAFFRKAPLDEDLDAEMASHLEMAVEENLRRGMTPDEARRQAMVRFGGVQQAREKQGRPARGGRAKPVSTPAPEAVIARSNGSSPIRAVFSSRFSS